MSDKVEELFNNRTKLEELIRWAVRIAFDECMNQPLVPNDTDFQFAQDVLRKTGNVKTD